MSEKERLGDDTNFVKFDLSGGDGSLPSYEHQNDINTRFIMPPLLPPHYLQPNADGEIPTHYPTAYYHPQQEQITGGQRTDQVVFLPGSSPQSQRSFLWPMLISCLTFWCCGFLFGSLAFLIAMIGQDAASRGDDIRSRLSQKISFGVSLAGIVIGLITIVVLGSMFGHYAANRISCPHGYYHHNGQRVCCGSVTCTHGVHIDSDTGCLQCCDPYSKLDCFKYGHVNDSQGCKVCCSLTKESCTYGFYNDSLGCLKCCERLRYSNFEYYTDSNGCKQSCPMYDYSSCRNMGYRLDHRGCKVCCDPRDPLNTCNCSNIKCDDGYTNTSAGCKKCCRTSVGRDDCTVMDGYFYDEYGCVRCCDSYNQWDCKAYGRYVDSNGCTQCCDSFAQSDCFTYGYYLDSRGCKVCCNPRLMNTGGGCNYTSIRCDNGFRNDTTDGKVCCPTNKESCQVLYSRSWHYYDSSGCPKCCENFGDCMYAKYNDSNGCLKCCERPPSCRSGYFLDSRGCTKCCDTSKSDTGCNCSNIRCYEYGWYFNASMGCKACCRPEGHCSAGTYYDAIGCAKCCQMIWSCPYGYFVDSKGCKKCCPTIYPGSHLTSNTDPDTSNIIRDCNCSNVQCLQGRIANHTCNAGGPMCCESADDYQCQMFGYFYDGSGCKKCCTGHLSPPGYICTNGFTRQNGTCGHCCKGSSDPAEMCSNS